VDIVAGLGVEHGRYRSESSIPESRRLLTLEQVEQVERLALERIRQAASEGILADAPRLIRVLYRWRNWGGDAEPRGWTEAESQSDDGLLRLLVGFQQRSWSSDRGDRYYIDPEVIRPFIDASSISERVEGLAGRESLTEIQQRAVQSFIDGLQRRAQGQDPALADEA
jgi:predicted KAP-like P-loop ATPase